MKTPTKDKLIKQGFHFSSKRGADDEDYYFIRFPVMFYKKTPTLEAEVLVSPSSTNVAWSVFIAGTNNVYAGYHDPRAYNSLRPQINKAIDKKMHKLGFSTWSTDEEESKRAGNNRSKDNKRRKRKSKDFQTGK